MYNVHAMKCSYQTYLQRLAMKYLLTYPIVPELER